MQSRPTYQTNANSTFHRSYVPRRADDGFTLVEALVALAIMGILVALATPHFSKFTNSWQLRAVTDGFFRSVVLAKNEAVWRNSRVVLCKSVTGLDCLSSGGWEQGWIVFHDINNNAVRETTETVIHRQIGIKAVRLTGNDPLVRYISFTGVGTANYISGGFQAGTLTVCNISTEPAESRHIVINAVGRPRVEKSTEQKCL